MKLAYCLLACSLALGGCGGDAPLHGQSISTSGNGASSNNGGSGTTSLSGTWKYTYVSSGCVETLILSDSGLFQISDLDEVTGGSYKSEKASGTADRYVLTLTYSYDNGGADCSGVSDFDKGTIETKYYELSSNKLNFYTSASSTGVIKSYTKSN